MPDIVTPSVYTFPSADILLGVVLERVAIPPVKEKIKSSWIGIDAWGGGDCCARLWEVLANKTMAMTQKYKIEFPHDFTDGENIVHYETIEEFEKKIRKYLSDKNEIQRISENGYQHLLDYHTSQKRVEYILDIINE